VGGDLRLKLRTNWGLVILRQPGGPAVATFEPLPKLKRGQSTVLHITTLTQKQNGTGVLPARTISAPGLILDPPETAVPGSVTITVPGTALPGNYAVSVSNTNGLGIRRFLVVE
jgi:hypothetical protein